MPAQACNIRVGTRGSATARCAGGSGAVPAVACNASVRVGATRWAARACHACVCMRGSDTVTAQRCNVCLYVWEQHAALHKYVTHVFVCVRATRCPPQACNVFARMGVTWCRAQACNMYVCAYRSIMTHAQARNTRVCTCGSDTRPRAGVLTCVCTRASGTAPRAGV